MLKRELSAFRRRARLGGQPMHGQRRSGIRGLARYCPLVLVLAVLGCVHRGQEPSALNARDQLSSPEGEARKTETPGAARCCPAGYWGAACEFCDPGEADQVCTVVAFVAERLPGNDLKIWLGKAQRVYWNAAEGAQSEPDGMLMTGKRVRIERIVQGDIMQGHAEKSPDEEITTVLWSCGGRLVRNDGTVVHSDCVTVRRGGPSSDTRVFPRAFYRVDPFRPDPNAPAIGWDVSETREALEKVCP